MSYLSDVDKARIKQGLAESGLSPEKFKKQYMPVMASNRLVSWSLGSTDPKDIPVCCLACGDPLNTSGQCVSEYETLEAEVNEVLGLT